MSSVFDQLRSDPAAVPKRCRQLLRLRHVPLTPSGGAAVTKVYVSATFLDLQDCRAAVQLALRRLRVEDMAMESYVAEDRRPLERCLADVASCDVYVGIFAWRYGFIPAGYHQSITELEYREALS